MMHLFILILFESCLAQSEFRIGGLFHDATHEMAFKLSSVKVMSEKYPFSTFSLNPDTYMVNYANTFEAKIGACSLLKKGIIALFGPSSQHSSPFIQSICDRKEIPHIEMHPNPDEDRANCLINLYPHPKMLSNILADVILAFHWHKMIFIYEDSESLSRLDPLLQLNSFHDRKITLRQLEKNVNENYRPLLTSIKKTGETNFILDCSVDILEEVLKQAQQVGLMTENYNYIITNLDMQTIDLSPFQYAGTNITGFRLIDPESPKVKKIANEIEVFNNGEAVDDSGALAAWKLKVSTALTVDAVELFYETIRDLSNRINLDSKPLYCNMTDNWKNGFTVINYMKRKSISGLTGEVKFDYEGFRRDFKLDLVELTVGGLLKVGEWNSTTREIKTNRALDHDPTKEEVGLFNRTFVVITCITPPYGMLKETPVQLYGNDRFEGFAIDLIHELSEILGFNYTFIIQEDGANGNYNKSTGEWNGMIKEVIDGRADLAITDLTITSEREMAVDFTEPFMNLGITILYRKPEPVPPSLFMFASPFSNMVWIMLGVAYFAVSILFFVMGRLSPSEWTNPYPCIEEPEYLINQFTIKNCMWFTLGSLLQQGSDLAPIGLSTRAASGVWWFFTLIMVSSYTANLAAFLTVEDLVTPFKNIQELVKHKEIKFGAKHNGATANFFRDSNDTTYYKAWQQMYSHPEYMTNDNDEGVNRVERENYAFLMESTTIEYVTERHCALGQVGGLLDSKGYGIAMKKFSPYRNELSTAVLKLKETGRITALKIKWWKEKRGGGNCGSSSQTADATALDLQNVGGVFLVLFIGTVAGFIGSFVELCLVILKKIKNKGNGSFKEELIKEMKFYVQFKQNVKEVEQEIDDPADDKLLNNCIK